MHCRFSQSRGQIVQKVVIEIPDCLVKVQDRAVSGALMYGEKLNAQRKNKWPLPLNS